MRKLWDGAPLIFLTLIMGLSCQRRATPKTQAKPKTRPAAVQWETFPAPAKSASWGELVQCLEQLHYLPRAPEKVWYEDRNFAAPIISLDGNLSLWGRRDTLMILSKEGLRSYPSPCAISKTQKRPNYCESRLSLQDSARKQRFIHLNREGLMYERRNAAVKRVVPADRVSNSYSDYMAFGEHDPYRLPKPATRADIDWLMNYLESAFTQDLTMHHKLRNLESQDRLQSCLLASKAYGNKALFNRVARLKADMLHFARKRQEQARMISFSVSLDKRDDVATALLTVHNPSDEPFYLEPDAEYPCFVALGCAEYKARFNRPHQSCPLGFAGAIGIEPRKSVYNIGLSQVYDAAMLEKDKQASRCPLVLGTVQPVGPR